MRISIIHPSRQRPLMAAATAKKWIDRAGMEVEYILSLDSDEPMINDYAHYFSQFVTHDNNNAVQAINNAAKLSSGELIIVVSDDFDCPENWAKILKQHVTKKRCFVAKIDDGLQPFIITLPIMDRAYYLKERFIYHPDYQHMYCDTHLSARAWMSGNYISIPMSFKHNHYSQSGRKDAVSVKADSTYNSGKETFLKHYRNNFGLIGNINPLPKHSGLINFR